MSKASELIEFHGLLPHPEGGYFKETYKSQDTFQTERGERAASTGIFYLLQKGQESRLHRIKSDEMWHFYEGDPLIVYEENERGERKEAVLGRDFKKGQKLQYVVPAGVWFGAYLPEGSEFALVGCTVSPGFDFQDFELA